MATNEVGVSAEDSLSTASTRNERTASVSKEALESIPLTPVIRQARRRHPGADEPTDAEAARIVAAIVCEMSFAEDCAALRQEMIRSPSRSPLFAEEVAAKHARSSVEAADLTPERKEALLAGLRPFLRELHGEMAAARKEPQIELPPPPGRSGVRPETDARKPDPIRLLLKRANQEAEMLVGRLARENVSNRTIVDSVMTTAALLHQLAATEPRAANEAEKFRGLIWPDVTPGSNSAPLLKTLQLQVGSRLLKAIAAVAAVFEDYRREVEEEMAEIMKAIVRLMIASSTADAPGCSISREAPDSRDGTFDALGGGKNLYSLPQSNIYEAKSVFEPKRGSVQYSFLAEVFPDTYPRVTPSEREMTGTERMQKDRLIAEYERRTGKRAVLAADGSLPLYLRLYFLAAEFIRVC